jgi:hypothetical protein
MINVYIRFPIWDSQSIGVNKKIIRDDLIIEILYMKKDGERLYPHTYFMRKKIALRYPIQEVKGVSLYIIPIHDLVVLTKEQIEYAQYCQMEHIPFSLLDGKEPETLQEEITVPKVEKAVQARMDWINN